MLFDRALLLLILANVYVDVMLTVDEWAAQHGAAAKVFETVSSLLFIAEYITQGVSEFLLPSRRRECAALSESKLISARSLQFFRGSKVLETQLDEISLLVPKAKSSLSTLTHTI